MDSPLCWILGSVCFWALSVSGLWLSLGCGCLMDQDLHQNKWPHFSGTGFLPVNPEAGWKPAPVELNPVAVCQAGPYSRTI